MKTKKVAQLLNELPLRSNQRNASVELRTDSTNRSLQFQNALKAENLCFKTFPTSADKIIIYVGNADFMKSVKFEANENLIIVPFTLKDLVISGEMNFSFFHKT